MKIKKAIITSAGASQHTIPLQSFVDRDGIQKTALRILIEEVLSGGVDEIIIVVMPGDQDAYKIAAGDLAESLHFVEQREPLGYGHALACARKFVGDDPFLHLVSDHLAISGTQKRCAQQLVEIASVENCSVSAVQPTHESMLPSFGAIGGQRVPKKSDLYVIENVLEKPTPTEAEQFLTVAGLRAGYYLCFFGMHVLTPLVMELLDEMNSNGSKSEKIHLSPALAKLARREKFLAFQVQGRRYDMGGKYGLLFAQLALALDGEEKDEVLAHMVELLASRKI
ncbi:MAG: UTP--glucose-1-phosphate uridylyltransferase [SAR324 cluster bacterium]|uniref:UTP--glucose-1-phosphate uridylyltransferase n=1 Tax=SAR324 cluster bacterium TaxID=2024889 RepID=A0A7X9FQC2_9DELT|nr:UTP--glucose-1-phosphate uridylyltransferase [SAR324 cluster bacterium]